MVMTSFYSSINSVINRMPALSPVEIREKDNAFYNRNESKSNLDAVLDFFTPRAAYGDTLEIPIPHITKNYKQFINSSKGLICVVYYNRCTSDPRVKEYFGSFLYKLNRALGIHIPDYAVDLFDLNNNVKFDIARNELNLENRMNDLNGLIFYYNGKIVARYTDYCDKCERRDMRQKNRREATECAKRFRESGYVGN